MVSGWRNRSPHPLCSSPSAILQRREENGNSSFASTFKHRNSRRSQKRLKQRSCCTSQDQTPRRSTRPSSSLRRAPAEGEDDPRDDVASLVQPETQHAYGIREASVLVTGPVRGRDSRLVGHRSEDKSRIIEFDEQRELLIRDKIVFDIKDERVKERPLREPKLDLPWIYVERLKPQSSKCKR